jgi:hypothetical protein
VVVVANGPRAPAMKMLAIPLMMMAFRLLLVVVGAVATRTTPRRERTVVGRIIPVLLWVGGMDATGRTVQAAILVAWRVTLRGARAAGLMCRTGERRCDFCSEGVHDG